MVDFETPTVDRIQMVQGWFEELRAPGNEPGD